MTKATYRKRSLFWLQKGLRVLYGSNPCQHGVGGSTIMKLKAHILNDSMKEEL